METNATKIEVYSSPNCVGCKLVKNFFEQKGVTYIEKDISSDEQAMSELEFLGINSVPVIRTNDELIIGFQKNKLEQLVKNLDTDGERGI